MTDTKPVCRCSRGATDIPEVPLWECPCAECTHLEWEAQRIQDETDLTLRQWRHELWPEHYPAQGRR